MKTCWSWQDCTVQPQIVVAPLPQPVSHPPYPTQVPPRPLTLTGEGDTCQAAGCCRREDAAVPKAPPVTSNHQAFQGRSGEGDALQKEHFPSPSPLGFINSSCSEVSINNGSRSWLLSWVMRFSTCCSCAAVIVFGGQNSMWIN